MRGNDKLNLTKILQKLLELLDSITLSVNLSNIILSLVDELILIRNWYGHGSIYQYA